MNNTQLFTASLTLALGLTLLVIGLGSFCLPIALSGLFVSLSNLTY